MNNKFLTSSHGKLSCIGCHGGEDSPDKDTAHRDLVADPSADQGGVCAKCHQETATKFAQSLHYNLNGFRNSLAAFSDPAVLDKGSPMSTVFSLNCNNCHASCGQCHFSQPNAIKGGLLAQHDLQSTPPMDKTCYGCHGARNAGEFTGNVGPIADVHYNKLDMSCEDCHPVSNFHGSGKPDSEMFKASDLPTCTSCHKDIVNGKSKVVMHNVHEPDTMSCQVCHSQASQNCYDCHISFTDEKKSAVTSKSHPETLFKIGLNPDRDPQHPWKYVVLRHIPTVSDSFAAAGSNLLPNYDSIPNWKMSPTHNIQRFTPQNTDCKACHGNERMFLRQQDLTETDSRANENLVVKKIPKKI